MKHLPAFKAAIFAAVGIVIGRNFSDYHLLFVSAALVFLVLSSTQILVRGKYLTTLGSFFSYSGLMLAFAFVMSLRVAAFSSVNLSEYRWFAGTVVETPRDTSSFSVLLDNCYGFKKGWEKINGEIVLVCRSRPDLETGDRLIVAGKAGPMSSVRNPGDFDFKSYYALAGITGRVFLKSSRDILIIRHNRGFSFSRSIVEPIRNFMRSQIQTLMTGEEAGLARAMVVGERMGISKEINEQFINTGTVHILCVSGLHVGFLTAILTTLAALLRIPRKFRFFVIAPILILYGFVVGMTPSIMRAVIMALTILLGIFLQRRSTVINSIGFAALLILTINPSQLYSPGFQLSFAAVLSIAFFYGRILEMIRVGYPGLEDRRLLNSTVSLAALTVAATLGTLPLTAFYFGRVSLVSVLANLAIVPMAGIFATMTFTFIFISLFSTFIASFYAAASQVIALAILTINSTLGSLHFSNVRIDDSRSLFGSLYFLWLAAVITFGKNILRKKLVFAIILGVDLLALGSLLHPRGEMKLFVLDVGQGDAIYVELPDGKNLLVDSGMKFRNVDAGERIIGPFLERRGVRKIDYFVITHLHSDHIGGAQFILRQFKVGSFIHADQISRSSGWQKTLSTVKALKIPERIVRAGTVIDSGAIYRIYVLHPNKKYVGEGGTSYKTRLNNGSVVLKVCIGAENFLLVGDIEKEAEHDLVEHYGRFLSSDVIKVGHHGSNTSSSEEFVDAVHPHFAAISVGAGNHFGHPSPEVLNRLAENSVIAWRTDSLGCAYFRAGVNTCELVDWR